MRRFFWFFIAFIVAEVLLMQQVASYTGWLCVFMALLVNAILGQRLLAGLSIRSWHPQHLRQQPLGRVFTRTLAGLLLLMPGFITDILALLLLLPYTATGLQSYFFRRFGSGFQASAVAAAGQVFEGEYQREPQKPTHLPPAP